MSGLQSQMRARDRDMVPVVLVRAMFGLMFGALALVAFAQWTDRPNEGVLVQAPIVAERAILLSGGRDNIYTARDAVTGDVIAVSSDDLAGFIGVIGRVIDRDRMVQGGDPAAPLRVVRRENGHTAVIDDTTGKVIELIGYGADNVAAFAAMVPADAAGASD